MTKRCFARARGEEEKNKSPHPNQCRMKPGGHIKDCPVDEFPPPNSLHRESVPPSPGFAHFARRRFVQASTGAGAELSEAGTRAGEANINLKFVNSAFHQRKSPLRINFRRLKSGENP